MGTRQTGKYNGVMMQNNYFSPWRIRRTFTFRVLFLGLVLASTTAFASGQSYSKSQADVESVIKESLSYNPKTELNLLSGDDAVKKIADAGYFTAKPSLRIDYSSYYLPKKGLKIFDMDLVYYDHEYLVRFIGCCVDEGNAIVLKPGAQMDEIERFARKNRCRLRKNGPLYMPDEVAKLLNLEDAQKRKLVELSCKYNDRMDFDNKH